MPVSLSCEPLRVWSRLEPRSRQPDFARNLAAEIYDPLWMLARQWQFGEFKGEDTGSPIIAKLAIRNAKMEELRPKGGSFSPFGATVPLEARVERQIPGADIETSSRLGNRWLRTLDAAGNGVSTRRAVRRLTIPSPTAPGSLRNSRSCSPLSPGARRETRRRAPALRATPAPSVTSRRSWDAPSMARRC